MAPGNNRSLSSAQLILEYITFGYSVHPLKPGSKQPILANWPNKASQHEATVRDWLATFPRANWGIVTGKGVSVLDIDPAALESGWPGDQRRQELKATGCPLVQTPRGGFHLYFKANWPNSVGVIAPGVDTKGPRGYVVAPPSLVNGKGYRWIRPLVQIDQLPSPPEWLDAAVKFAPERNEPAAHPKSAEEMSREGSILYEGNRNIGLTRFAGRLRRLGFSQDEIAAALLVANRLRCRPPLPEREVLAIAKSISKYPTGPSPLPPAFYRAWSHAIAHRRRAKR
ncbi:MAG: bifunctional DNA primase/polymerase [Thermogutta sp.]